MIDSTAPAKLCVAKVRIRIEKLFVRPGLFRPLLFNSAVYG